MDHDIWILDYSGIELNEKKQTRNKKLKNKSIDERNAKPNKPNGKRILREMQSQKGKNEISKGQDSQSESQERRKLNKTETLTHEWLRVEAKANVVIVVLRKDKW